MPCYQKIRALGQAAKAVKHGPDNGEKVTPNGPFEAGLPFPPGFVLAIAALPLS
ncbi:hypothetical protein QF047_003167 [Arthrobacter sp. W4I7]|nr:hypothetical protein [Arthrobacter sp. W4I7]